MAPPVRHVVSRCAFFDLQERTWRVADQRATGLPAVGVGLVGFQGHVASIHWSTGPPWGCHSSQRWGWKTGESSLNTQRTKILHGGEWIQETIAQTLCEKDGLSLNYGHKCCKLRGFARRRVVGTTGCCRIVAGLYWQSPAIFTLNHFVAKMVPSWGVFRPPGGWNISSHPSSLFARGSIIFVLNFRDVFNVKTERDHFGNVISPLFTH